MTLERGVHLFPQRWTETVRPRQRGNEWAARGCVSVNIRFEGEMEGVREGSEGEAGWKEVGGDSGQMLV